MVSEKRLIPTGECWCGCGEEVELGRFFKAGHNRIAIQIAMRYLYGSNNEAKFLAQHGLTPEKMKEMRDTE